MNYIKLFDEIVKVMTTDYSGYEIKRDWANPAQYRDIILQAIRDNTINRDTFKQVVEDYLLDYKDGHVKLKDHTNSSRHSVGFKVRRLNNQLFVTEVGEETNVRVGYSIIALDDKPIEKVASMYPKQLLGQKEERQQWNQLLVKHKEMTIMNLHGEEEKQSIRLYVTDEPESSYDYKRLSELTMYMSFNDFVDYGKMESLLKEVEKDMVNVDNLIIDVRHNSGGADSVAFLLADYIFPQEYTIQVPYGVLTNMTERNLKNRLKLINDYLKANPKDNEALAYKELLLKHKNKGLVNLSPGAQSMKLTGSSKPANVVVLIDTCCASSGESFAMVAQQSPKVTLIGRPTAGILDYANVAEHKLGYDFSLSYATSVSELVLEGIGIDNVGLQPDIYVPWTCDHLTTDVDLNVALKYFESVQSASS